MEKEACPSHKPQDLGLSNRKGAQVAWSLPRTTSTYSAPAVCQLSANDAEAPQISARGQLKIKLGKWTCKQIISTGSRKGNGLEWLQPEEGPGGDQEGFLEAVTLESFMRSWN